MRAKFRLKFAPQKRLAVKSKNQTKEAKFADFKEIFHHRGLVLDGQALAGGVDDADRDAGS